MISTYVWDLTFGRLATPVANPHLNSPVLSTALGGFIRCHWEFCAKFSDVLGRDDYPDGPQARGDASGPLLGQVLARNALLMLIGKANQQNVIPGSAVLRQKSPQAKNVDPGEIIKLIGTISRCINLLAREVKAQADSRVFRRDVLIGDRSVLRRNDRKYLGSQFYEWCLLHERLPRFVHHVSDKCVHQRAWSIPVIEQQTSANRVVLGHNREFRRRERGTASIGNR